LKLEETKMPFEKGQSGNPAGRPRGARSKRTILAEKLFDEHAEQLWRDAIQLAKTGNAAALRECMERFFPRGKHRALSFELRPIATAADALAAMGDIVQAVADGDLSTAEATQFTRIVQNIGHAATNVALEPRVAELEADAETKKKLARLRRGG
jgi:hypothetical protein